MSREQETLFLKPFFERAHTGEIATVAEIRDRLDDYVGHAFHDSVVYRFPESNR